MIIPYGKQEITDDDINGVIDVLKSDYLTQGPKIKEFEDNFSEYIGCDYSIAVSNGTAALHLCILSLDIKPNDIFITTPITFAASANCVKYCGGSIEFVDIDEDTYTIDYQKLEDLLNNSPKNKYKGIILVNFAGKVLDLEKFYKLAKKHDLYLIEDACHSLGGTFLNENGEKIKSGSGKYSDLSIFSFHPVKHICCGEGGMITTNNQELFNKISKLRTHGITKNKDEFINSHFESCFEEIDYYPEWYMEMQDLGYNYRLTEIQASLGISQLKRIDSNLISRKNIARKYQSFFEQKKYNLKFSETNELHAYHLYVIETENRLELYNYLKSKSIYCQIHYYPLHLMPYYRSFGFKLGDYPNSENYYKKCLSLPMYHSMTNKEQDYILNKIELFYE